MEVHHFDKPLARLEMPRMAAGGRLQTRDLVLGEWSLTAAAWTDRHDHEEINYVLEGELHVTCDGVERILQAGEAVLVDAGSVARYAAPVHARMLFIYGPSPDGRHGASDTLYEELATQPSPVGESI
jgi:quercetin dioxygenase-like cupin family protein